MNRRVPSEPWNRPSGCHAMRLPSPEVPRIASVGAVTLAVCCGRRRRMLALVEKMACLGAVTRNKSAGNAEAGGSPAHNQFAPTHRVMCVASDRERVLRDAVFEGPSWSNFQSLSPQKRWANARPSRAPTRRKSPSNRRSRTVHRALNLRPATSEIISALENIVKELPARRVSSPKGRYHPNNPDRRRAADHCGPSTTRSAVAGIGAVERSTVCAASADHARAGREIACQGAVTRRQVRK